MQLRVLHLRNYGTTFRPWMWIFVKLTISEEAIENARGWIGGMRSKRYSNGMFALAPGKSWRTYSQKRKREFLMTDPYAQSYRDYSYLVLKRSVRFALRGGPGRLIHSSRTHLLLQIHTHLLTRAIMALVTTLQNSIPHPNPRTFRVI